MKRIKEMYVAIRNFILRTIIKVKNIVVKKELRVYRVIASNTPSMVGTTFVGTPNRGKTITMMLKAQGYLTIDPTSVAKFNKGDRFTIYGKYSRITAKRIR